MMSSHFIYLYCLLLTLFVGQSTVSVVEAQGLLSSLLVCPNATSSNGEQGCFLGNFGFVMYRGVGNQCQEKCVLLPPVATSFGWKCGFCDVSIAPPASSPVLSPRKAPERTPVAPPPSGSFKCGGAVNTGGGSANAMCTKDLWNPTQNRNLHCYAYGGVTDPCALHNNNDVNDGLFKSPVNCDRDTFYLWDEVCFLNNMFASLFAIIAICTQLWFSRIHRVKATLGLGKSGCCIPFDMLQRFRLSVRGAFGLRHRC